MERQVTNMAKNPPKGPGRRGEVKDRDQIYNPKNNRWTKRNDDGKFMDQKHDDRPFKGVRKK